MTSRWLATLLMVVAVVCSAPGQAVQDHPPLGLFFQAASTDVAASRKALEELRRAWRDGYSAMLVDVARLIRPEPRTATTSGIAAVPSGEQPPVPVGPPPDLPEPSPRAQLRMRLTEFLEAQTRQRFGDDLWAWREWLWKQTYDPHPDYAAFKRALYGRIDARMEAFFPPGGKELVRLDEVDWGGVLVNGIPPLDHPKTVGAGDASFLKDDHVVFGLVVNGEARAYPKRILGWHELARDRVGGMEIAIVYCTLCGTVIPYSAETAGRTFTFGTSGLLYRSNKLMFDAETNSLWSSLEGRPVIGELAGTGLQLRRLPVVTTTWGEWRREHPATTVLSLETGHKRDYSEGAAYRDYFATDRLMFQVSHRDTRLKNKAEVLTMLVPGESGERLAVAIAADFLKRRPLYQVNLAGRGFVVLTSSGGANRVYEARSLRFTTGGPMELRDERGRLWRQTEEALVPEDAAEAPLRRVAAHRAFWFGWFAQFPQTTLIK